MHSNTAFIHDGYITMRLQIFGEFSHYIAEIGLFVINYSLDTTEISFSGSYAKENRILIALMVIWMFAATIVVGTVPSDKIEYIKKFPFLMPLLRIELSLSIAFIGFLIGESLGVVRVLIGTCCARWCMYRAYQMEQGHYIHIAPFLYSIAIGVIEIMLGLLLIEIISWTEAIFEHILLFVGFVLLAYLPRDWLFRLQPTKWYTIAMKVGLLRITIFHGIYW